MEKTFLAIKPDGIQRGLIGKIISRLEEKGFKLVAMKFMLVSNELAQKHYGEHKEKPFFKGLVDFITSGPVVAMIWEGKDVINALRKMMGKTNKQQTWALIDELAMHVEFAHEKNNAWDFWDFSGAVGNL